MRAAQVVAPGDARIVETPKPELQPGHALVRPRYLSLCGSDVHMVYYHSPELYPFPPGTTGHEMVGVVEAVDAPGSGIEVGTLALTIAPDHRAMAEYYLAPVERILPLPNHRPAEHLLMAQQLGTVIFASKRLPGVLDQTVAVLGQGSVGLYFDFLLRRLGAATVIGIDVKEARVAASKQFGATHSVNNTEVDAVEAVKEITGGELADVVIEAAGEAETINLAPRLLKPHGTLLYFGIPRKHTLTFDFYELFRKYATTLSEAGTAYEPGFKSFRQALRWISEGEIDVEPLLTHRFPFDQVVDAYALARSRDDGAIKIVVEMP
jgi:L-iditol 2-dehydrogenase